MLEHFFQLTALPSDQMVGIFDTKLVILSYIIAIFASYIALDITSRLRDKYNTPLSSALWICGGSLAMGAGIWSMHFIGMLAFSMGTHMYYDPLWTVISMLIAIAASALTFVLLNDKAIKPLRLISGGIILGFAIAAMHYTGMAAMRNHMNIHYLPGLFFLSILIAVVASEAALFLALKSAEAVSRHRFRLKVFSALIMGAAICGMHYTGMYAAVFTPTADEFSTTGYIEPEMMAIGIAFATFIIMGVAFIVSAQKNYLNEQLLQTARQVGMAEVAVSIMHNVGNALNSVSVSSELLSEKIRQSKLSRLVDLNALIKNNQGDLTVYIRDNPDGKNIPLLIDILASYWKDEHEELLQESQKLIQSIDLIKAIIATQNELSSVANIYLKSDVSIEDILEESIIVSDLADNKLKIKILRKYKNIKLIKADKMKLLAVLVTLIKNAKDAISESSNTQNEITFIIDSNQTNACIQIKDTGIGIASENLTNIFGYGFTTKNDSHGFGLHTSAISVNEMGGKLTVASDGPGKGSTFTIELPK